MSNLNSVAEVTYPSKAKAAKALNYAVRSFVRWAQREKIPQPFAGIWRHSDLEPKIKERQQDQGNDTYIDERGEWITLKTAAPICLIPYRTLLRELRKIDSGKSTSFLKELGIAFDWKQPAYGGKKERVMLKADALRLREAVEIGLKSKPPKGMEFTHEIGKRLHLKGAEFIELRQCLRRWRVNGQLTGVPYLRKQSGKVTTRKHVVLVVERLRLSWAYDVIQAMRLWESDCSVAAGAALVKALVPAGQQVTLSILKKQMEEAGFVGIRYDKACNEAGLVRRSRGSGVPWVAEMPNGRPRKSAEEIIQEILAEGPVKVKEGEKLSREAGLSPHSVAFKKAWKEKRIESVSCQQRQEDLLNTYSAPSSVKGEILYCLADRKQVAVAGTHNATVPWPYKHSKGRRQLILCGDLVKALKIEHPVAVAKAWGVHECTVRRWRKILELPMLKAADYYWCLPGQNPPVDAAQNGGSRKVRPPETPRILEYQGHSKKPQKRGPTSFKEPLLEAAYIEYKVRGNPLTTVWQFLKTNFPGAPKEADGVKDLTRKWSKKFDPPLPLDRTEAAKFRRLVVG